METDLSMMPHMSICRSPNVPRCCRCTRIRSTTCRSRVRSRMQPWNALKGFLHRGRSSSAGQPESQTRGRSHGGVKDKQFNYRHQISLHGGGPTGSVLTPEEEVTFYGHGKRVAGLGAASFLFVHADAQTTSSGVQLHRVPLTVIQGRTWGPKYPSASTQASLNNTVYATYIQDCLRKLEYCDKVLYFL